MSVQMIFIIAYQVMRYLMCNPSNIPIGYLKIILPTIVVELVYTITIDDHVMWDTLRTSMDCVEVGFGDCDLHFDTSEILKGRRSILF
jgi:hypothetical protein